MKLLIFLYVIIFGYDGSQDNYRVQMPNMEICQAAVVSARVDVSHGDESEYGTVVFCGTGDFQTYHNGYNWHKGDIKEW